MKTVTKWVDGLQFISNSEKGHGLPLASRLNPDEPLNGIPPVELMLHGIAGCSGMDIISILQKMKQPVKHFTIEVDGERAETHPKVFTKINILYKFTGTGIDPASVERAINLSEEKYCSVSAMLRKACEIHTRFEIIDG